MGVHSGSRVYSCLLLETNVMYFFRKDVSMLSGDMVCRTVVFVQARISELQPLLGGSVPRAGTKRLRFLCHPKVQWRQCVTVNLHTTESEICVLLCMSG